MRKVLIVDDSATMRKILMRSLRQAAVKLEEVLEAANGVEALEQIAKCFALLIGSAVCVIALPER